MGDQTTDVPGGISRRRVLTRGALVGGAIWAAPAITTLSQAGAQAAGSPACSCDVLVKVTSGGVTFNFRCTLTPESCACLCACNFTPNDIPPGCDCGDAPVIASCVPCTPGVDCPEPS